MSTTDLKIAPYSMNNFPHFTLLYTAPPETSKGDIAAVTFNDNKYLADNEAWYTIDKVVQKVIQENDVQLGDNDIRSFDECIHEIVESSRGVVFSFGTFEDEILSSLGKFCKP